LSISDGMGRAQALATIAVAQAKAGNASDALRTTQAIDDAGVRVGALADVAGSLPD
jgi:hypothetical protein